MANIETKILSQSRIKPTVWKRFIDDGTSLWNIDKQEIDLFLEQGNSFHSTIKFTAEISDKKITFLDTVVYIGERFQKDVILDIKLTIYRLNRFQESLSNFKTRLLAREYTGTKNLVERILPEVSLAGRQSALKQKKRTHEQILP